MSPAAELKLPRPTFLVTVSDQATSTVTKTLPPPRNSRHCRRWRIPSLDLSRSKLQPSYCSAMGGYSSTSRPSWIRPIRQGRSLPNPPASGTSVLRRCRSPLPVLLPPSLLVEKRARLLCIEPGRSNARCLLGRKAGPAPDRILPSCTPWWASFINRPKATW